MCSIGGNAATNAGGLCCVKYGVTTDYILGLKVVLADGTVVRLGGPRLKDSAGLSLTKLFVGSEGTLGIITEFTLRLLPPQPPANTVVASFTSVPDATNAIREITRVMRPAMREFMDHPPPDCVRPKRSTPDQARSTMSQADQLLTLAIEQLVRELRSAA